MPDDNHGLAAAAFSLDEAAHVGDETAHGATYVEIVHAGGTDARKLGAAIDAAFTLFRRHNDHADGATAESASAKGEGFVEAVIELGPFAAFDEFGNGGGGDGILSATEQQADIFQRGGEKLAFCHGLLKRGNECIHTPCIIAEPPGLTRRMCGSAGPVSPGGKCGFGAAWAQQQRSPRYQPAAKQSSPTSTETAM